MNAAWYEEQGDPAKVLKVGELPDQMPGPGEVKVKICASGVNPTDTYTRSGIRRRGMPFERIVPHQDGAGVIVAVGEGVPKQRIGERVETGTWFMNRCDYLDPALAWVGVKDSGRGCTLSRVGYEHLTRPKSYHLRLKT